MADSPKTSLTLLSLARTGDTEAWNRLVNVYGPLVYQQCKRKNLSDDDAAEVAQDVFLALHGGLKKFRKERPEDSFIHWLRRVTSFKIADRIRLLVGQANAFGGTDAQVMIEQQPEEIEAEWQPDMVRQEAFSRAIDLMKTDFQESTWRAFWITVVEGKTTQEACEILSMKPGAIRNARSKVRKRLVQELGDVLDLSNV